MSKKIRERLKSFDSLFSIGEKFYNLINFAIIFFGGAGLTSILAWLQPQVKNLGFFWVGVIAVAMMTMIFLSILMFKLAKVSDFEVKYYERLSQKPSKVNPLDKTFNNLIIPVEDLRLPRNEIQIHKTFEGCHLVGPMTIMIAGGSIHNSAFDVCGDMIALPDDVGTVFLEGVMKFKNCNFINCVFTQVTFITSQSIARDFTKELKEIRVIGIK
ncbi:hypothetical protein [Enterobacter asburiae]|uniref:hypothetical protein n=1 Tax=Enterobacter asburiae TaxID=61645 RepID=UPI000A687740|nr:hypothetical protein [Enterobacter asburiae]